MTSFIIFNLSLLVFDDRRQKIYSSSFFFFSPKRTTYLFFQIFNKCLFQISNTFSDKKKNKRDLRRYMKVLIIFQCISPCLLLLLFSLSSSVLTTKQTYFNQPKKKAEKKCDFCFRTLSNAKNSIFFFFDFFEHI